jgi:bestrophin, other
MTVSYSSEIATSTSLTLLKLLFRRWRGSVFRLIWNDLLFFILLYYILQLSYSFKLLNEEQREIFRIFVNKSKTYTKEIRIEFLLGFFVSNVMSRWWIQYETIPWPYSIAVYVSTTIHGFDEMGRAFRRTIMRYVCLSLTMVFRVLSPRVTKRFPKMDDLVEAGLLNENELSIIELYEKKYPGLSKNWLPICWAASLASRARQDGRIKDDLALKTIIKELNRFRARCGVLMNYATISE